jgi:glutathione S-transferase
MLLYSGPLSLFARKVEVALAEKAIQCDRVMVPFTQTRGYAPKHPVILAANPKGQVPVFVDGDLTLYDSTIIVEYLDDKYPLPPLFPKEPRARARCRLIELEADEVFMVPVRDLLFRSEPPGADTARRAEQERKAREAEDAILVHYGRLEAKLGDEIFFCGEFSAADIATFMVIHHERRLGGPPLDGHPKLQAWYSRLAGRPAFAAAMAEMAAADRELSYPVAPYRKRL